MTKIYLLLSALLLAQSVFSQDSSYVEPLDEVVVTANRYPKKMGETGKVVTVLNRAFLEKNPGKNLGELISTAAGIQVPGANNNPGETQTITMRGSGAGNVLVLIDGLPVSDPSVLYNYFDLNFINAEQVERIEILKGGQSSLYGSDAVAGVINIIMRQPKEGVLQGNLSASSGSFGSLNFDLGLRGRKARSAYGLQYGYSGSKGFSTAFDSSKTENYDRDGFRQHRLSASYQYAITKKLQFRTDGRMSIYKVDLDETAFKDDRDSRAVNELYQASAGLEYAIPRGSVKFNYQLNLTKRFYHNDSIHRSGFSYFTESHFKGSTQFAELFAAHRWEFAELLYGVDLRKHQMDEQGLFISNFGQFQSSIESDLATARQLSGFASFSVKNNKGLNAEIGGRWNNHALYGNNFTYNINPSALINKQLKLFANLYRAYKTPTLYQLFAPFAGYRQLKPEESTILEGGFSLIANEGLTLNAVYFHRDTRNAIHYIVLDPSNFESSYRNARRQRSYGLETGLEYQKGIFDIRVNYTYTDGKTSSSFDDTGSEPLKDTVYNNLYRIARNRANIHLGLKPSGAWYMSASLLLNGRRQEPVYGSLPIDMDAYHTINLHLSYQPIPRLKLFLDLRNLTDQQYFEVLGYTTRRINFLAGFTADLSFKKTDPR